MKTLIQAYLNAQQGVDAPEVKHVEPFTSDGEQQWEITVFNLWLDCGESIEMISISELLLWLYNKEIS